MNFYGAKFCLGFIHNCLYPLEKRKVIFEMHRKKKGRLIWDFLRHIIYQS